VQHGFKFFWPTLGLEFQGQFLCRVFVDNPQIFRDEIHLRRSTDLEAWQDCRNVVLCSVTVPLNFYPFYLWFYNSQVYVPLGQFLLWQDYRDHAVALLAIRFFKRLNRLLDMAEITL